MTNLTFNHQDSIIVLNRGLTVDEENKNNLGLRCSHDSSLLGSIDSKQMVKNLSSSQKYIGPHDFFITLTCNMKKHFGTAPVKNWLDAEEWTENFPNYNSLTSREQTEIKRALTQSSSCLFLQIWQEVSKLFTEYF